MSPDKRRKYDEAFKTEALRLAGPPDISPKLLCRWQQAQLVAKVGSEEVPRNLEVRALRTRLKWTE